jgi:ABC-type glycerol-3-phosphate transport system substrate-binding protein
VPSSGWAYNYIQLAHEYGAELEPGSLPAGGAAPRVVVDSPGMRKAFDYEVSVYDRLGGFDKAAAFVSSNGSPTAPDPLMSGRVGMFLQGDWQLGQQAAFGAEKFRDTVGVVAMPAPPGGQQYLCHSGWAYSVPKGAKHAAEAMQFVAWMEQPDHFATYLGQTLGWLPARKATLNQSYITSDPTWQKILEIQNQTGTGAWLPPSPILAQYYRSLDNAESSALSHKQSSEAALQTAQKEVDDALKTAIGNNVYQS